MSYSCDWNSVEDENVEVNQSLDPYHVPTGLHHNFQLEPSNSTTTDVCRVTPEIPSPASSYSSLSLENGFPSELDVVRRGHPAWVARPRNAFIIFRCEYARKHARQGKRVRHPPGTNTEKTVSKLAAEAWHDLPAEKKDYYKDLAEQEKEQHAKIHPDYRFRPVKKGTAQKKRPAPVSKSESQPLIPSAATEPAVEPLVVPQPSQGQGPPIIQPSPQPSQPHVDIALVKAGRRRSASVPLLTIGSGLSFTSGEWDSTQPPRLRVQRSRSALGNRPSMSNVTSSCYENQLSDTRMSEVSLQPLNFFLHSNLHTTSRWIHLLDTSFQRKFTAPFRTFREDRSPILITTLPRSSPIQSRILHLYPPRGVAIFILQRKRFHGLLPSRIFGISSHKARSRSTVAPPTLPKSMTSCPTTHMKNNGQLHRPSVRIYPCNLPWVWIPLECCSRLPHYITTMLRTSTDKWWDPTPPSKLRFLKRPCSRSTLMTTYIKHTYGTSVVRKTISLF